MAGGRVLEKRRHRPGPASKATAPATRRPETQLRCKCPARAWVAWGDDRKTRDSKPSGKWAALFSIVLVLVLLLVLEARRTTRGRGRGRKGTHFNFLTSTLELRPLWSYFSRRAGGRSSGEASAKPPFD